MEKDEPKNKPFKYQYNEKEDEVSQHRGSLRQALVQACKNINNPYVLAIKGGYGTGKTTFLKHLKNQLEDQNIATIWFDAWESDYSNDPFASLIASFDNEILEKYFKEDQKREEILQIARKCGAAIGKFAMKSVGKLIAGANATEKLGVDLKQVEKIIDNGTISLSDYFGEKLFIFKEAQRGFTDFAEQLTAIAKAMPDNKVKQNMEPKIVIFVDELDRCRPDYAIQVLEVIKHFFDAEGIIFVLSICEEAMKGSVSSVYHPDIDYIGYMNKFVDMSFELPVIPPKYYWDYMQKKEDQFEILPNLIHQYLPVFLKGYDVPLRDQNRIFASLLFMFQWLPEGAGVDEKGSTVAHDFLGLIYILSLHIKDFPKKYEKEAFSQILKVMVEVRDLSEQGLANLRMLFGYFFYKNINDDIIKHHITEYCEYYFPMYDRNREDQKHEDSIFAYFLDEEDSLGPLFREFPYVEEWLEQFKNLHLG